MNDHEIFTRSWLQKPNSFVNLLGNIVICLRSASHLAEIMELTTTYLNFLLRATTDVSTESQVAKGSPFCR